MARSLFRMARFRVSRSKHLKWRLPVIVLVAFVLRLAATQLPNFENLMAADHMHAWEQGNVAEALVAGRGFGSPFQSNQLSAVMPPVYPIIVAGLFKLFGIHTASSIFAAHLLNCVISALACIPIFLVARRSFGERAAWWSAWGWAQRSAVSPSIYQSHAVTRPLPADL